MVLTKANDYGIAQLALDGQNIGKPIDCYSPKVTNTEEISLGTFDLEAGKHLLRATVIGANERATNAVGVGNHVFGLDYLRLRKPSPPRPEGSPTSDTLRPEHSKR